MMTYMKHIDVVLRPQSRYRGQMLINLNIYDYYVMTKSILIQPIIEDPGDFLIISNKLGALTNDFVAAMCIVHSLSKEAVRCDSLVSLASWFVKNLSVFDDFPLKNHNQRVLLPYTLKTLLFSMSYANVCLRVKTDIKHDNFNCYEEFYHAFGSDDEFLTLLFQFLEDVSKYRSRLNLHIPEFNVDLIEILPHAANMSFMGRFTESKINHPNVANHVSNVPLLTVILSEDSNRVFVWLEAVTGDQHMVYRPRMVGPIE